MDPWPLPALLAVAGIIVAAIVMVLINRHRMRLTIKGAVETAVLAAEHSLQSEFVRLRERARFSDDQAQSLKERIQTNEAKTDAMQDDLRRARDDAATLHERVQRVPILEDELRSVRGALQNSIDERQRLTSDFAISCERVSALHRQSNVLTEELRTVGENLAQARESLSATAERKAVLEEAAGRVPALEKTLGETQRRLVEVTDELAKHREASTGETRQLKTQLSGCSDALGQARDELVAERDARAMTEASLATTREENGMLRIQLEHEKGAAVDKLKVLVDAKADLTNQFKALANEILEDKSTRFTEQNRTHLEQLLSPLRTQISEFKMKVDDVYVKDGRDRASLKTELQNLLQLNQTLSKEAHNLTRALKGEAKTRGNWGEMILETVLDACGLRNGIEYSKQESKVRDDGSRSRPDIILNLPERRRIVVDSKVSLVDYEAYVATTIDEERDAAARKHGDSIRAHIKGLSDKQYQALYAERSLDFVLMFVPIEPAYMLAIDRDNALWLNAWEKNVILVSPSTLLPVLRMVALLWRQESQSCNAQEIAKRGAELYDRLVLFMEDLQDVGKRLDAARLSYDAAAKRLSSGKGNVLRQAEMLKELGVKPAKTLAGPLFDEALSSGANVGRQLDDKTFSSEGAPRAHADVPAGAIVPPAEDSCGPLLEALGQ